MALLRRLHRDSLRGRWPAVTLLFAQLVTVFLIVFQAMEIVGLHVDFYLKDAVIKPNPSVGNIAVLALAIILFALLYLAAKKRQPMLFEAQKRAPGIIKEAAKEKIGMIKSEPQAPALLLIEFLFVAVLIIAMRAYLDPELELIPWSKLGIGPPITTVVNAVIAIVAIGVFYYLYSLTKPYREWSKKGKRPPQRK